MADIFFVFRGTHVPTPFMTLTFLGGRTADGEGCRTFCGQGVHAGLDSIATLRDGSEYFPRALEQISSRMGVSLLSISHTVTLFISAVCSFVVCSCSSSNNLMVVVVVVGLHKQLSARHAATLGTLLLHGVRWCRAQL